MQKKYFFLSVPFRIIHKWEVTPNLTDHRDFASKIIVLLTILFHWLICLCFCSLPEFFGRNGKYFIPAWWELIFQTLSFLFVPARRSEIWEILFYISPVIPLPQAPEVIQCWGYQWAHVSQFGENILMINSHCLFFLAHRTVKYSSHCPPSNYCLTPTFFKKLFYNFFLWKFLNTSRSKEDSIISPQIPVQFSRFSNGNFLLHLLNLYLFSLSLLFFFYCSDL